MFFITLSSIAPNNAIVYIDKTTNTYVPPNYYPPTFSEHYVKTELGEVKKQGIPSKEGTYDFNADRNLLFEILHIPIWSHPYKGGVYFQPRWNSDGSWNW